MHPSIKAVAAQERNNAVKLKGGAGSGCYAGNACDSPADARACASGDPAPQSNMPAADLQELEAKLGHTFNDRNLLVRALTHRSFAFGQKSEDPTTLDNERLEFLGDSILGFLISECLVLRHRGGPRADCRRSRPIWSARHTFIALRKNSDSASSCISAVARR